MRAELQTIKNKLRNINDKNTVTYDAGVQCEIVVFTQVQNGIVSFSSECSFFVTFT